MASAGDLYLPNLIDCFSGQSSIILWTDILTEIVHENINGTSKRALQFLSSPSAGRVLLLPQLLAKPVPTLPRPSAQSRANFESKIAAINITPRPDAPYSVDEIKDDTLWLSKTLDLDEIECLRIVVFEWQTRPKAQLQQGLSETEAASLRDALGSGDYSYASGRGDAADTGQHADPSSQSQEQRRARLLVVSMQEQSSTFRISAVITDIMVLLRDDSSPIQQQSAETFGARLKSIVKGHLRDPHAQKGGLPACFDGLHQCLEQFSAGPSWAGGSFDSNELQDEWTCAYLYKLSSLLQLVLLHHQSPGGHSDSTNILSWLKLMSEVHFFLNFEPQSPRQAILCHEIQVTASTCTLALLYLSAASEYIERVKANPEIQLDRGDVLPYFMDPDAAAEIHQLILSFAAAGVVQAAPAVLAWGLIIANVHEVARTSQDLREASHLQKAIDSGTRDSPSGRRLSSSSIGSIQQSLSEDVMDGIRSVSADDDDVHSLTLSAVESCDVFQYIASICASEAVRLPMGAVIQAEIFQQLIITSITQLRGGYSTELMVAQLALIEALADIESEVGEIGDIIAVKMRWFQEESGVRDVLDMAASRFPYEALSFLQLCNSFARLCRINDDGHDYIATYLQNMPTFTQATAPSFSAYRTTREYENANLVSLDTHLGMIDSSESQRLLAFDGQATALANTIPAGTIGEVISNGKPIVIKWLHSYSGFTFLGLWLESFRCGHLHGQLSDQEELETTATVILELLSRSLRSTHRYSATKLESACALLDEIASGLPDDVDLVSMTFDIFEQQLQSLRYRKQNVQSCDIVVACLKLIATLLKLLPNRVWSSLSRSMLLDTRGASGGVLAIILSIETTREVYGFLEAYAELYQALTDDAVGRAVSCDSNSVSGRVSLRDVPSSGTIPTRIVDNVLHASTKIMMDAFQAASRWSFGSLAQRTRIVASLSQTFCSVIHYVYGADDVANPSTKLTAGLASSAVHILDVLRPHVDEAPEAVCLLRWYLISWRESVDLPDIMTSLRISKQVCAVGNLTRTVLLVGVYLGRPQSALEAQVFDALPIVIRLGILDDPCFSETLDVIHAVLQSTPQENSPSILGRLGSASARDLLENVSPMIRQPKNTRLKIRVWNLFTSLITHNQQWFAIVLLTGSPPELAPRQSPGKAAVTKHIALRGKPALLEALDQLTKIDKMEMELAAATLQFVVKSQTYWNWVTDSIDTHPTLLTSLTAFVSSMRLGDSNQMIQSQCNKTASLVVELAIVQLHHARSRRDEAMIHKMIPMMRWLTLNAINVDGYNLSLHSSLRKNFSARYATCTLANFKRTQLFDRKYGSEFYYDLQLAEKMLSHRNPQSRRPDFEKTFHQEIIRVNLNLSLVDSQLLLLNSFQSFCVEHCNFFSQDQGVQRMMAAVVQNLLAANTISPPSEQIFETLFQTRAEFALVLVRRLTEIKSIGSEFTGLLSAAWNALKFRNATYEFAIDNDDLVYFRTTLAILLLALQFHTENSHHTHDRLALVSTQRDPTSSIVLEVASTVVADGIKSVVGALHEQATDPSIQATSSESLVVDTKDVSLILLVLQTTLRLHILPQIISQLGSGFVASSATQSCLLLYSWSHTVTTTNTGNEPVYADLSLRFLVSLSSLPQVAEELAVEGVLSRISTARITQVLRATKGGVSRLDKRPFVAALYGVWTAGILPLCLNLLHSVGRAMAGEVASFLNQFPDQLLRAAKAFSYHAAAGEPLTLALANEGAVLALISRVLANYRAAGASAGVDAYDVPVLEGYDEQKLAIVEDVKEILVGGKLKVRATPTTEKEAAWQRMKMAEGGDKLQQAITAELTNVLTCLGEDG